MRPFEGVLVVEGVPDHDGRRIAEGALTWRKPVPIFDAARQAILGHAYRVERVGLEIRVVGQIGLPVGEYGVAARVRVDEHTAAEDEVVARGVLLDAAITDAPSFKGARIVVGRDHIDDRVREILHQGVRSGYLGETR